MIENNGKMAKRKVIMEIEDPDEDYKVYVKWIKLIVSQLRWEFLSWYFFQLTKEMKFRPHLSLSLSLSILHIRSYLIFRANINFQFDSSIILKSDKLETWYTLT